MELDIDKVTLTLPSDLGDQDDKMKITGYYDKKDELPLRFLNFNEHITYELHADDREILRLVSKCREIRDVAKKTKLLEYINQLLPLESRIRTPSLITSDGIDNLLSWIEVKISPPIYGLATP